MLPAAFSTDPESNEAHQYEQLILDGILAVRSGNFPLARRLLNQAASINSADARIWIWLSATTDNLHERRSYLESAIEIDPSNTVAKRGLLLIAAKLAETPLAPEAKTPAPLESQPYKPPETSFTPLSETYTFGLPQASPPEVQDEPPVATLQPLPAGIEEILSYKAQEEPPVDTLQPLPEEIEKILSSAPDEIEPSTSQEELPPSDGEIRTIGCPNCGGIISYDVNDIKLVCPICGFTRRLDENMAEESPQEDLAEVLPLSPSVQWSEGQARLACEVCGAVILFTLGQNIYCCPYCASSRLTIPTQLMEMVDPQAAGMLTIDADHAARAIKDWLGKGVLAPDNLASRHAGIQLHPAYYPFWLISGRLEVPWFCDVKVSSGSLAKWEAHTGMEYADFDAILIPAIRKLSQQELDGVGPFNLDALVEFSPDTLASWPVMAYDVPLADASIQARQRVIDKVQQGMINKVEAKSSKRNFRIGDGRWNDLTSRLILLPIYIGNYPFQGKRYRLLVNGQTGKVGGKKPIDRLKASLYLSAGVILLIVAILLIWLLSK